MTRPLPALARFPHLVEPAEELPYKRGETAAEIAERLRKGIRRRALYVSEREQRP